MLYCNNTICYTITLAVMLYCNTTLCYTVTVKGVEGPCGVGGYIYMHNDREGYFEVSVNHLGLHDGLFTLCILAQW